MNQQQLIEQKAKAILQNSFDKNIKPLIPITFKEAEGENGYNWIYEAMQEYGEWMQGEGERLRESIDIEQLIPELMDKRVEEVMREAFGKTTILDKTIYEGENAYYLSRKQIAEDLLDKFYIIPKPQTEHE